MIVGIDEVGRGALAGPLTVAAVALGQHTLRGLDDSKKIPKPRREQLSAHIKHQADGIGIGWISAKLIDQIGMSAALKLAAARALSQITLPFDQVIIDGTIKLIDDPRVVTLKKADSLIAEVSAASIIAKVARDHYMYHLDPLFPEYGFRSHVGYGTPAHLRALSQCGGSPIHRYSFAPLAPPQVDDRAALTTGMRAELAAADFLRRRGYQIIATNWKTKWCEIDIIASKNNRLFVVEVKYRRTSAQGTGLDYITPKKQQQMRFAAKLWQRQQKWPGDIGLSAIALSGPDFVVAAWLPDIDAP